MPRFPQLLLDVHQELIIDLFAGGGGASSGIEAATGRQVDVAINHDAAAVELHKANHPQTRHRQSDVFEVDPREVTDGRPVGLLWASPDCTYFSKAKGGKPIRRKSEKRRALAWVVKRWAGQVRPRVICLENVEEFVDWGRLIGPPDRRVPCPKKKGRRFRRFVRELERLGYVVEHRELRACDYGAPTIRKRLFLIARCDGQPIVWPEATHGPGTRKPYRTAAECIDWSIPMLSVFATPEEAKAWARAQRRAGWKGTGTPRRPLADATLRRIARGVVRYVIEAAEPFVVSLAHGFSGGRREYPLEAPIGTQHSGGNKFAIVAPVVVNTANGGTTGRAPNAWPADEALRTVTGAQGFALTAPILAGVGGRMGQSPEKSGDEPMNTITAKGDTAVVAPIIVPNNTSNVPKGGDEPVPTVTGGGRNILAAPYLIPRYGERKGQDPRTRSIQDPHPVVVPTGNGAQLVSAFLAKHYGGVVGSDLGDPKGTVTTIDHDGLVAAHIKRDFGTSTGHAADSPLATITADGGGKASLVASFLSKYYGTAVGQPVDEPAHTLPTKDRLGLVTVMVAGAAYVLADIAMRMLQPRELYRAQGFPDSYVIDRGADGRWLTKAEQVRMVGNSVAPPVAEALVRANCPELRARDEAAA